MIEDDPRRRVRGRRAGTRVATGKGDGSVRMFETSEPSRAELLLAVVRRAYR